MKKIAINILWLGCLAVAALLQTSCEVDNYAEPDGIIFGKVTDAITGQGIITEQPEGFRIRYYELSWSDNPAPRDIWGMVDGTYRNAKMFAGHYRIEAIEGAFVPPPAQEIDIRSNAETELNFTVTPYVSFSNVSIAKTGADEVTCTFNLKVNVPGSVLRDFRIYASDQTKLPGTQAPIQSEFSTIHSVNGVENSQLVWDVASQNLTEGAFTVKLKGYVAKGAKVGDYVYPGIYWIRIAARTNNSPVGRYNMTAIEEVSF
ncbi:MAG: DUF3823 domain-containing protein [Tannerella sp.]|jgi:hypothetical protein|nr:DUF3823 domain-containing protein [Tannerella sp.]